MTQFQAPIPRRAGGSLDVYTALLCGAFLVLAAGVALLAMANLEHSRLGTEPGGVFKIVSPR